LTPLKDKLQTALDESRILVLGIQVLIGFQFNAAFARGFHELPPLSRELAVGTLALMLLALALIVTPAAYHRIVAGGEDSWSVYHFILRVIGIALLPFALSLGANLYIVAAKLGGPPAGVVAGVGTGALALFLWYGLAAIPRRRPRQHPMEEAPPPTELKDKIRQVLTETRVVLPGAQALLGFQFGTMFMAEFDQLSDGLKRLHLASLCMMAVSTILLMAPAAYHRIVERGEDTEALHRFAGRALLGAMVPLALGVSGDFYVVVAHVTGSLLGAALSSAAMLGAFFGLWFGYPTLERYRRR
jgi:hypothetical protein